MSAKDVVQNRKRKVRTADEEDQLLKLEEKKKRDLINEVELFVESLQYNSNILQNLDNNSNNILQEAITKSDETVGTVQGFMDSLKSQADFQTIGIEYLNIHAKLDSSMEGLQGIVNYDVENRGIYINGIALMYKQGTLNNKAVWDLLWKRLKWHKEVVKQLDAILQKSGSPISLKFSKTKKEITTEYASVQGYL